MFYDMIEQVSLLLHFSFFLFFLNDSFICFGYDDCLFHDEFSCSSSHPPVAKSTLFCFSAVEYRELHRQLQHSLIQIQASFQLFLLHSRGVGIRPAFELTSSLVIGEGALACLYCLSFALLSSVGPQLQVFDPGIDSHPDFFGCFLLLGIALVSTCL